MTVKMRYFRPDYCNNKNMIWKRKHNGFGFLWTGSKFLSLEYKEFSVPKEICISMPNFPIQGEFWKEDSLSKVSSIVTRNLSVLKDWVSLKIIPHYVFPEFFLPIGYKESFDIPTNIIIEDGFNLLKKYFPDFNMGETFCTKDSSIREIENEYFKLFNIIKENRWEGIVLTNLDAYYEDETRSKNFLKIKPNSETDCYILGYEPGKTGKNIGKVGSLNCYKFWSDEVLSFPNGQEKFINELINFNVSGLTDYERDHIENCYPINSKIKITFKYISDLGIPQNANVQR